MGVSAFRVLGPVEAWTDERRLVLGGPQQVKLLAFLLLNANRALSADAVIDAVWGAGRQGAAKRLQMGVSRLRQGSSRWTVRMVRGCGRSAAATSCRSRRVSSTPRCSPIRCGTAGAALDDW